MILHWRRENQPKTECDDERRRYTQEPGMNGESEFLHEEVNVREKQSVQ